MSIQVEPGNGLKLSTLEYRKLKAFQSGGYYWDQHPQQLIRQYLGEFLPQVEIGESSEGAHGVFRKHQGGKERLSESFPAGRSGIPPEQLADLRTRLDSLARAANADDTQPHNKALIDQFRLPNPETDPELYRIYGPPWNRSLQILWGCEKTVDSSLAPTAALRALKSDSLYRLRRILWGIFAAAFLCFLLWALANLLPKLFRGVRSVLNDKPVAEANVGSMNLPTREVELRLGGADKDGTVEAFEVDWGDGSVQMYPATNSKPKKTYGKDGDYEVKVTSIDNLGARSKTPASKPLKFDHEAKVAAEAAAKKRSDEIQAKEAAQKAELARQEKLEADRAAAVEKATREAEQKAIADAAAEAAAKKKAETEKRLAQEAAEREKEETAKAQVRSEPKSASPIAGQQPDTGFKDVLTGRNVKPINFKKPEYPREALAKKMSGMAQVSFTVDTSGSVKNIRFDVSKNLSYFQSSIMSALKKAKFAPAMSDGEAFEQRVTYVVEFNYQDN